MTVAEKCTAAVYVRDTYRRTGRGKSGYEMHYQRKRCARSQADGTRLCWQHQQIAEDGADVPLFERQR